MNLWLRSLSCAAMLSLFAIGGCQRPGGFSDYEFVDVNPYVATRWVGDAETGEGLTLIQANVNDEQLWMVLDSGSEAVVLDRWVVDKLRLESSRSVRVGGCGLRAQVVPADGFRLGPLRFDDPVFLALDLSRFFQDLESPVPIGGVLGVPALAPTLTEVTYAASGDQVRLLRGGSLNDGARFQAGRPATEIELAPGVSAVVAIDTGKSGGLSLSSHFDAIPKLREQFGPVSQAWNRRLCGVSEEEQLIVTAFRATPTGPSGPLDTRLRIPGTEAAANETSLDGVLGREGLREHTVSIDFMTRRTRIHQAQTTGRNNKR